MSGTDVDHQHGPSMGVARSPFGSGGRSALPKFCRDRRYRRSLAGNGTIVSQVMSVAEREWFLSGVRLGVVSVADSEGRAPISVPVWYGYEPGGDLYFITSRASRKATLIKQSGRLTLCTHND